MMHSQPNQAPRSHGTLKSDLERDTVAPNDIIDNQDTADRLVRLWRLAGEVQYYSIANISQGNWQAFVEVEPAVQLARLAKRPTPILLQQDNSQYKSELISLDSSETRLPDNLRSQLQQQLSDELFGKLQSELGVLRNQLEHKWHESLVLESKVLWTQTQALFASGYQALADLDSRLTELAQYDQNLTLNAYREQIRSLLIDWACHDRAFNPTDFDLKQRLADYPALQCYVSELPSHVHLQMDSARSFINFVEAWCDKLSYMLATFTADALRLMQQNLEREVGDMQPHVVIMLQVIKQLAHNQNQLNQLADDALTFYYHETLGLQAKEAVPEKVDVVITANQLTRSCVLPKGSEFIAGQTADKQVAYYHSADDLTVSKAKVAHLFGFQRDAINNNSASWQLPKPVAPVKIAPPQIVPDDDGLAMGFSIKAPSFHAWSEKAPPLTTLNFELKLVVDDNDALKAVMADEKAFLNTFNAELIYYQDKKAISAPLSINLDLSDLSEDSNQLLDVDFVLSWERLPQINNSQSEVKFTIKTDNQQQPLDEKAAKLARQLLINSEIDSVKVQANVSNLDVLQYSQLTDSTEAVKAVSNASTATAASSATAAKPVNKVLFANSSASQAEISIDIPEIRAHAELSQVVVKVDLAANSQLAGHSLLEHYQQYFALLGQDIKDLDDSQFSIKAKLTTDPDEQTSAADSWSAPVNITLSATDVSTLTLSLDKHQIAKVASRNKARFTRLSLQIQLPDFGLGMQNQNVENEQAVQTYLKLQSSLATNGQVFNPADPAANAKPALNLDVSAITLTYVGESTIFNNQRAIDICYFSSYNNSGFQTKNKDVAVMENLPEQHAQTTNDDILGSQDGFILGLTDVEPNSPLNLLVDIEATTLQTTEPANQIEWSYLSNNQWQSINSDAWLYDQTAGLLDKGVVSFMPVTAELEANTILPKGVFWLRAQRKAEVVNSSSVERRLNAVYVNGVRTEANNIAPPIAPMVAGTIKQLRHAHRNITKIEQPYYGINGKAAEPQEQVRNRIACRLRHKNRLSTRWDHEHLILQNFSDLQQVYTINHYNGTAGKTQAGHVTVVLVPDLAPSAMQCNCESEQLAISNNLLKQVNDFVASHGSAFVEYHVMPVKVQPVTVNVTLDINSGFTWPSSEKTIVHTINQFFSEHFSHSNPVPFNTELESWQLKSRLEPLPCVKQIESLTLSSDTQTEQDQVKTIHKAAVLVSATTHQLSQFDANANIRKKAGQQSLNGGEQTSTETDTTAKADTQADTASSTAPATTATSSAPATSAAAPTATSTAKANTPETSATTTETAGEA